MPRYIVDDEPPAYSVPVAPVPTTAPIDAVAALVFQDPQGEPIASVVCAERIVNGLPVYVDRATRQLRLARADNYRAAFVVGLVAQTTAIGFVAAIFCGRIEASDWSTVTGSVDLVPGFIYYLAPQGGLTTVPPVNLPGVSIVTVGRAADARTLFVAPSNPILQ